MKNTKVVFKHERFNLTQCVYGDLTEDASLEAVKEVEKKLGKLMDKIEKEAKNNENFNDSHALEMCVKAAATTQELILFVHQVAAESRCPSHPMIAMIQGGGQPPS